jgi:histidyl-tRNA synthetase
MLLVLQASNVSAAHELDAFMVYAGEGAQPVAWQHAERVRDLGLRVLMGAGGKIGSQLKKADTSGARYALIVGEDEVKAQRVTLKPLRGGGSQETLEVNEVLRRLKQTIQES